MSKANNNGHSHLINKRKIYLKKKDKSEFLLDDVNVGGKYLRSNVGLDWIRSVVVYSLAKGSAAQVWH